MHQQQVIEQLLAWIEQSLDQPLTLDDIAAKSGYSKWHLQRMFKQHTGHILGTYARRRRLTAAARELRLTGTSVACIADTYQFDSQQTFTRCFRKQFGLPPASYRRSQDWSSYGLQPPLRLTETPLPQADIVTLPPCSWWATPSAAALRWGSWRLRRELRRAWRQLLQPQALPEVVYGLTSLEVDRQRRGNPRMAYTAALPDEGAMGSG